MPSRQKVYKAIDKEREHQDNKLGTFAQMSLPGFLLIMRNEITCAIEGWLEDSSGRDSALRQIVATAAVAVACLEKYGVEGSASPTDDIPEDIDDYVKQYDRDSEDPAEPGEGI